MSILQASSSRSSLPRNKRRQTRYLLPILSVLLPCLFILSVCFGSTEVSLISAISDLFSGEHSTADFKIIFGLRLPRALSAILVGAALSVSGVVTQAVLANPMASPSTIGVNAGAGLFAVLVIAVFPSLYSILPLFAFFGALVTGLLIYFLASKTAVGKVTITLIGVAIGSIFTAAINAVKILFPDSIYDISTFMIGGLSDITLDALVLPLLLISLGIAAALGLSRTLDILTLGDASAASLGLAVGKARLLWLTLASVLAGCAVSIAGLIGFVGLIVPQMLKQIMGASHRPLIGASALGGACLLLFADLIARIMFSPYVLPVGILLSFIGGPFFIFLIYRRGRVREDA